jgi:hypothetical protein
MANTTGYTMYKPVFRERKPPTDENKTAAKDSRQAAIAKRLKRLSEEKTQNTDAAKSPTKY